jgi:transcription-repair coupling factor (superfamily II helicase)
VIDGNGDEFAWPVWWNAAARFLESAEGRRVARISDTDRALNITSLPDTAKSFLVAALMERRKRRAVIFVPDEARARTMALELACFVDKKEILTFHARDYVLYDAHAVSRDQELQSSSTLTRILFDDYRVLLITADASKQRLMNPDRFGDHAIRLTRGEKVDTDQLEKALTFCGYERVPQIECPGHFARRGDIVDIWPSGVESGSDESSAVRLSFFDVILDEVKSLDPETQRSIEALNEVVIPPARLFLLKEDERKIVASALDNAMSDAIGHARKAGASRDVIEKIRRTGTRDAERFREIFSFPSLDRWLPLFLADVYTVLDYIPKSSRPLFFLDEPLLFSKRLHAAHEGFLSRLTRYVETGDAYALSEACELEPEDVFRRLDQLSGRAKRSGQDTPDKVIYESDQIPSRAQEIGWESSEKKLNEPNQHLSLIAFVGMARSGNGIPGAEHVAIHARAADRYRTDPARLVDDLKRLFSKGGEALLFAGDDARAERLSAFLAEHGLPAAPVLTDDYPRGFAVDHTSVLILGSEDLFGTRKIRGAKRKPSSRRTFFKDLEAGALVVHEDHGVGRYEGTKTIITSDGARDYLTIAYQDALLHMPVDRIDLISPYIPAGGGRPRLSKMGGNEWHRQKERARTSIRKLVTDIVALYAQRRKEKGHVYRPDTLWQQEFEDAFPYEETDDQQRVIAEIKADMESEKIMDRLVCGDVGFGKTEIAFRAMFKCVMEGKQAAMLAPTTILVQQHYENLTNRIAPFPIRARSLSRFSPESEQKRTVKELETGTLDIVIGTHRMLSKDVRFHDLGLLVIDEEQRFGVDHKEMIKALSPSVEVLTLSATPIPRTLHLSLSGIHDISILEEGPEDRLPIQTTVIEYDEELVIDAIAREQARRGQVFYVHNNTHTIDRCARELSEKMPGVRFGVAHGRMSEKNLETVINAFLNGEFDVLVCTTIIESGIDMPRVNTLIVEDADRFGLAQLYQLRGRVGRSGRQAYALITYRPERVIGEEAEARLAAIRDYTELGSGFKIALRDLEVRGAGNLLGAEQSGHLDAIGYDLCSKMLEEEVVHVTGEEKPLLRSATVIDLVTDATLPLAYIQEGEDRLEMYRRVAAIKTIDDYRDVYDELLDRYGNVPDEAEALLDISYLRAFGERVGFSRIRTEGQDVEMILDEEIPVSMEIVSRLIAVAGERDQVTFMAGYRPKVVMAGAADKPKKVPSRLRDLFAAAERMGRER